MKTSENPMSAEALYNAVGRRKSSRTYNGLRIDRPVIAELGEIIGALHPLLPGVSLPVIKIVDNDSADGRLGTYGVISGARQYFVMAAAKSPSTQVQAGYMFEQLILAATVLGLDTCWLGGTFRRGRFAQVAGDCGDREVSIVSPTGHSTPKMRFAERMMRRVVKSDRRKPFGELFSGVAPDSAVGKLLEAVRLAPSSSNSQPWRATVDKSDGDLTIRFSCTTSNSFSAIDMGIAYAHFLIASAACGFRWSIHNQDTPLSLVFRLERRG